MGQVIPKKKHFFVGEANLVSELLKYSLSVEIYLISSDKKHCNIKVAYVILIISGKKLNQSSKTVRILTARKQCKNENKIKEHFTLRSKSGSNLEHGCLTDNMFVGRVLIESQKGTVHSLTMKGNRN